MKTSLFIISILIASVSFSNSQASKTTSTINQAWERLGSRTVTMTADHDEIVVTANEGIFTAIQLRIAKAPIHLLNINIIFGNGDNENVVFDQTFEAGSQTRVIDLAGNKRIIRKVNLNYRSAPTQKGRAIVSLWGKH
ncbi:MAG: hypothetical protein IPM77_10150 [Crocinitomicaceae bacterium]|nr:hypothetical protein [Crocinitomicaceae bacterium]